MFNKKIEILSLWIIIKIIFHELKAFDINQINQTQKNKTIDESINVTNPINNNKIRNLQTADYESIRIYMDTFYLKSKTLSSKFLIYNESLYRTKNALEKLIKVKREINFISKEDYQNKIKSKFGNDVTFDSQMSLNEIDLVIFVHISTFTEILYDKDCNEFPQIHEIRNKRPIIGFIIIDNDLYTKIDKSDEEKYRIEFLVQIFYLLMH